MYSPGAECFSGFLFPLTSCELGEPYSLFRKLITRILYGLDQQWAAFRDISILLHFNIIRLPRNK